MSRIPENLRYSDTHEWVEDLGNGRFRIGITDHAQELLGDVVYVEGPEPGRIVVAGEPCGVLESVKAASDLFSPLSGQVIEQNAEVAGNPQWLNEDPYGKGWIFVVETGAEAWNRLLDSAAYLALAGQ